MATTHYGDASPSEVMRRNWRTETKEVGVDLVRKQSTSADCGRG